MGSDRFKREDDLKRGPPVIGVFTSQKEKQKDVGQPRLGWNKHRK